MDCRFLLDSGLIVMDCRVAVVLGPVGVRYSIP